ncbi:hypothetical protein [Corallococcus carmarthensis]|uniref:Lipoprotein n=1 Tax=Corallococcus carmarthensis TaxID=2316728 RepID=A0A3A8KSJ2_9BACT|nr:hypothetical protein [Corallococcus carmarthensis]NOK16474.1 hypothetical protein [Corallococcus carmarthensis]RKH07221.1 hypothetical protein D7X32_02405 [Corallococcus carmarthensis]
MKKLFLGVFLAAMPFAVGCGGAESMQDETGQLVTSESGVQMSIQQRTSEPGEAPPDVSSMNVSGDVAAGCWVVLNWCRSPSTGGPECTATNCTIAEAIQHCEALINQTC